MTTDRTGARDPGDLPARLREALLAADFTHDAVAGLLGTEAHAALGRNETVPGLRATTGGSPLETLTRLFLLQAPVPVAAAEAALPGLVDRMAAEGLVAHSGGQVGARLDVRPYATAGGAEGDQAMWVVSDLTPGLDGAPHRAATDHVLGVSSASTSLAQLTLRHRVESALDLGTGCGVQALHLAAHAGRVVATDVNPRALRVARLTAALNRAPGEPEVIEVRDGSFYEPVAGEEFDLIATNPPFVISPATGERLVYRDSGLPGDQAVEHVVRAAPAHLRPGGWCQVLANWVVARGRPWGERLTEWVDPGCDAFVVQREVLDPAAYVELWLKDSGHHGGPDYTQRYDTWLSWLDAEGVEGIGFGWVNLRRRRAEEPGEPVVDTLDWPWEVQQPVAPAVAEWADGVALLRGLATDDDLAAARLVAPADLRQETHGQPGAEDPEVVVLRRQTGLRRARQADTVEAALVGACDGDLAVGQVLDALASLLGADPATLRAQYLPVVRTLVAEGFLDAGGHDGSVGGYPGAAGGA